VLKFDAGTALTYQWRSGVFHLPSDVSMAAARVNASAYPLTFKLYADGALKFTKTVASASVFRLPSGYRSRRYQVELSGTSNVREVGFATSVEELTSA
jgi:hypothetical protein